MNYSLFRKDIQPFVFWFVWLLLVTMIIDYVLHQTQWLWVELYSGILGTFLIIISFAYSIKKKKIIKSGKIKTFLRAHEYLAWTGSLLVLVHGGIHFNAILPWAAVAAMLVAVISGLIGKYLLKQSTDTLNARKGELVKEGLSNEEIEKKIFWDSLAVKTMQQWRTVHKPITIVFGITAALHIFTIFMFWRWNR